MCLSNCATRQAIVQKICSNLQKTWQVIESTMKKNYYLVLDFRFFVSDIISGIVLSLFSPLHVALDPNR